jgi:ribosomal protein L21
MAHLIPRKENDGVKFQVPQKTISEEELQATRKILSESLGAKAEETKVVPTLLKMPREKKVVEAKFKEKKQHKKKKPIKNKETKKEKKSGSGESINLDDIAKVLGPG